MKKNVASQSIGAEMITSADGTAFTGTVTVVITIDNGTQSASGGTAPAHEGNGYHSYAPTQAETNGDHLAFTFTGTGAIPATVQVFTSFPQTVDNNVLAAGATGFAAIDTVVDAILDDTVEIGAAGAGLTDLGGMSTAMKAEVNAEADTALTDYDGPTNTEMVARTLVAASYFDPAADTVATVTTVTGGATSAAQTTAQNDLDIITGASGVNLLTATQASIDAIEADTNELQTDWANGGRLDLLLDAIPTTAMRGTDSALLAASINLTAGAVDTVTTCTTTTTNTDMVAEPTTLLTTQMAEAYAADATAPTLAQALFLIQQTIGDFAIAGTTITTKKIDGSTTAATYTLDDGTNPTSRTRAT